MSLFRRSEPLHQRLARLGGIPLGEAASGAPWAASGIHGVARPREWDVVVTVDAAEAPGDADGARFVALPDGDLVVEDGPNDVRALAEAVDAELRPPYRAEATRHGDGVWAVGARSIEVAELPGVEGEELVLTVRDGIRTLVVDGERGFGTVPQLERDEHVVRARRIDGDLWEVETAPL